MSRRLGLGALLLYLALDCANPLMPGAVCFDPEASVEALSRGRPPSPAVAAARPDVLPPRAGEAALARRSTSPPPLPRRRPVRRARATLRRPLPEPAPEAP
jgi:hypothetical protein